MAEYELVKGLITADGKFHQPGETVDLSGEDPEKVQRLLDKGTIAQAGSSPAPEQPVEQPAPKVEAPAEVEAEQPAADPTPEQVAEVISQVEPAPLTEAGSADSSTEVEPVPANEQ